MSLANSMFLKDSTQKYIKQSFISTLKSKYDADVILTFLNHIANTFLANKVRLSNNLEGEVIYINPEYLARPTVKCGDSFIDLSRRKDIYITAII